MNVLCPSVHEKNRGGPQFSQGRKARGRHRGKFEATLPAAPDPDSRLGGKGMPADISDLAQKQCYCAFCMETLAGIAKKA
jgi:hypothetical protein